jgi:hypothetical protein
MEQETVIRAIRTHLPTFPAAQPDATRLLLNFLHGLQQGLDAESILETLAKGEEIEAPVEKKRGRKKSTNPKGQE